MINRKNLLLVAAMSLSIGLANASSLVQMDIKKSSDNAVDVTFYTTGSSSTPMVTRKSDNKYVVLMPNVSGTNAGTPSLGAVKDLVTNVDIKNVDDGMNGYTKVTFITTKPLNIKTHTQKTAPLSTEENEAKAIIAQVKTHPKQTVATTEPKKEVAKTKVASTSSSASVKKDETKPVQTNKTESVKKAEAPKTITKKTESKPISDVKTVETKNIIPAPVQTIESLPAAKTKISEGASVDFKEIDKISKSEPSSNKNNFGWLFLIIPTGILYFAAKGLKNSIKKSEALKFSFNEHLAKKPYTPVSYDNIINDTELNWQERYRKFIDASETDEQKTSEKEISKANIKNLKVQKTVSNQISKTVPTNKNTEGQDLSAKYHFVTPVKKEESKKPMSTKIIKNALSATDVKRIEFEKTLEKTPEIYKNTEIKIDEQPSSIVKTEDETIQQNIAKLKAFAKPVSLSTSHRNRVKRELPKTQKAKEGRFVQLKETEMSTTTRQFRDGALSVSDLINTSKRFVDISSQTTESDYIMSSVDEYMNILDKENSYATAPKDLSTRIANSLSNVKPSMKIAPRTTQALNTSNPIKQTRKNSSDGLVIKKSYNIDENHGFHLVNLDGVNSLIGRANNETFVLHNFSSAPSDLQVRHDSENVYMVKSGEFKAMVDVEEDKIGTLIEL